jgi:hypothetical protein
VVFLDCAEELEGNQIMKKTLLILSLVLSGCVGTMTSVIDVEGFVPENESCLVRFERYESGDLLQKNSVTNRFKINLVLGHSHLPINILLVCNDKLINKLSKITQSPIGQPLVLNFE